MKKRGRRGRPQQLNLHVSEDVTRILDHLYLSAKGVSEDLSALDNLGVGYIVNCTCDVPNHFSKESLAAAEDDELRWKQGFSSPSSAASSPKRGSNGSSRYVIGATRTVDYFRVAVVDTVTADVKHFFEDACEFIEAAREKGSSVLVHCTMGMSRSSTIVIAYLMKVKGMRLSEAMAYTKNKRPVASPNAGFMSQLIQYEISLFGAPTVDLDAYSQDRFAQVEAFAIAEEEKKGDSQCQDGDDEMMDATEGKSRRK